MTIKFQDPSLADSELFSEAGPCHCADGDYGYSVFVTPCNMHTEIILTESELRSMLNEVESLRVEPTDNLEQDNKQLRNALYRIMTSRGGRSFRALAQNIARDALLKTNDTD